METKTSQKMILNPEIVVLRDPSQAEWTLSEYFIQGIKRGVGVEDEERKVKKYGETRIANGIYPIDFTYSERFSKNYFVDAHGFLSATKNERFNQEHLVMLVMNVPDFTGIRWHWGNTDLDSLGCYIVGSYIGKIQTKNGDIRDGVVSSRINYVEQFYPTAYNLWLNNKRNNKKTYVEYKDKVK